MAWNEPGSGKQRDPWRDNGGGNGPGPDMDALVRRLREFFNRLFGGRGGGPGIAIVAILLVWLAFDSVALIKAGESGVVLRFGQVERLMPPGINFKLPRPIETLYKVNVGALRTTNAQVRMLTRDENIVLIDFNVQYLVTDPQKVLFNVRDPDGTLGQAAESAVRSVIGGSNMDTILSGQRAELIANAKQQLQTTLDQYNTGLTVNALNFQNVRPPQEVKDAFDDASRALQDKQRLEEEAKAYASKVVPEARGDAATTRAEAEGYKSERVARAEGDAQRFNLIQSQYRAAPEVTRKRMYLETMQDVMTRAPKVIDFSGGKNILNLPGTQEPRASAPAAAVVTPEARGGR
ncbi:FtsH protease activity modulator HflK [Dokdonella sp.]|uniref:FtsH protease activity modulator HflK n=1 Tax=Dokdonella sp. TaxID=2291710 RepID=UPI002602DA94|nr:FtsH protease activity modulator HflK [Dokdonella sp.]